MIIESMWPVHSGLSIFVDFGFQTLEHDKIFKLCRAIKSGLYMLKRFRIEITVNALLVLIFLASILKFGKVDSQTRIAGSIYIDPFWVQFTQKFVFTANNWIPFKD